MIYLDNHATTRMSSEVLQEILPYLTTSFGNPSSAHSFGLEARSAVEKARSTIADLINARPDQVFFTSGASESNNTILRGLLAKSKWLNNTIITSCIEHPSILKCAEYLNQAFYQFKEGPKVYHAKLPVNECGELSDFEQNFTFYSKQVGFPLLCSIHAANNEIGTIYDLERIGFVCKSLGVFFHTDATQAMGKVKIDVVKQNINALSFSAHKINGPKGIGVLFIKDPELIDPLILGGLQEKIRSGTVNVANVVGMAKALEMACSYNWGWIKTYRDLLFCLLDQQISITLNGPPLEKRLPNNLNVSIPGVKSEILIKGMNDVIVSAGSACKSGKDTVSDVLVSIKAKYPDCAIRFGLDRFTTAEDVIYAAKRITQIVKSI